MTICPATSDISTSRVNRLLRSLRVRCAALKSCASAIGGSKPQATYSSKPSSQDKNNAKAPPLQLLAPPEHSISRVYFHSIDIENQTLARRIYAVRDAFRDVVMKSDTEVYVLNAASTRLPKLSDLCATIVGADMEPVPVDDDAEFEVTEESEDRISDLYDFIPRQYRRSALLCHALFIVLDICPHHPTLLRILLDVTMAYGLLIQSSCLLETLLNVSFSAFEQSAPYICHGAHSTYLVHLRDGWVQGHLPLATFLSIVGDCLCYSEAPAAWSSKAVVKLVHENCARDPFALFSWASILILSMDSHQSERRLAFSGKDPSDHGIIMMRIPLHHWLSTVVGSSKGPLDRSVHADINDFFNVCRISNLQTWYTKSQLSPHPYQDILGLTLSFATQCLLPFSNLSPHVSEGVAKFLKEINPLTSMYDHLVRWVLSPLVTSTRLVVELKLQVKQYTSCLRHRGLLTLESSLLACFLHHLENLQSSFGRRSTSEIDLYRRELIEAFRVVRRRDELSSYALQSPSSSPFSSYRVAGGVAGSPSPLHKRGKKQHMLLSRVRNSAGMQGVANRRKQLGRGANFHSIISDAQSHRTNLHRKQGVLQGSLPVLRLGNPKVPSSRPKPDVGDVPIPSSDDLNLCKI